MGNFACHGLPWSRITIRCHGLESFAVAYSLLSSSSHSHSGGLRSLRLPASLSPTVGDNWSKAIITASASSLLPLLMAPSLFNSVGLEGPRPQHSTAQLDAAGIMFNDRDVVVVADDALELGAGTTATGVITNCMGRNATTATAIRTDENTVVNLANIMMGTATSQATAVVPARACSGDIIGEELDIDDEEAQRLISVANKRKRNRFNFFNSEEGVTLRLRVHKHLPTQDSKIAWCAMCGNWKDGHRGHRTKCYCRVCNVALCTRLYAGQRETCFEEWHSEPCLVRRRKALPAIITPNMQNNDTKENRQ